MYPDSGKNLNYETESKVCFFTTPYDPFSNWSPHQIKIWEKTFSTLEHAYHYKKFDQVLPKVAQLIFKASSPWAAKLISRQYENQRRKDWERVKLSIMRDLVVAKFQQHQDARDLLLTTGRKTIIENSPWDNYWGAGEDGTGDNNLGKILMAIRDELSQASS